MRIASVGLFRVKWDQWYKEGDGDLVKFRNHAYQREWKWSNRYRYRYNYIYKTQKVCARHEVLLLPTHITTYVLVPLLEWGSIWAHSFLRSCQILLQRLLLLDQLCLDEDLHDEYHKLLLQNNPIIKDWGLEAWGDPILVIYSWS